MWTVIKDKKKLVLYGAFFLLLAYCLVVKVIAATKLDYYSDEPDDVGNVLIDYQTMPDFFDKTASPDQARLPHLIAAPIIMIAKESSLLPTRVLFILVQLLYLVVLYKLFRLSLSKMQAFYGMTLTALSAYAFSFSIFTMTTSNNLFLLLGTLMLYLYLRYFKPVAKTFYVNHVILLGIVSGLAVASRFFSGLILVTIFIYDGWFYRKRVFDKDILKFWKLPVENINIIFTVLWLIVNLVPALPVFKLSVTLMLVIGYLIALVNEVLIQRKQKLNISFLARWLIVVHTAFIITLISSPIHLNIKNIVRIFDWSKTWHTPINYINPSRFDIFTIIGVKLGIIGGLVICLSLIIIALRRQMKQFISTYALFILLIIVHLLLFIQVKFVIVWYPLLLIPFFYLPLAYIFPRNGADLKKPLLILLAVILIMVPIYEQYRYWHLFPYGHIDGAQYGSKYIGWNKPGAISFEASHQIIDYIYQNQQLLPPGKIGCHLVDNERYNPWAAGILSDALVQKGLSGYECDPVGIDSMPYMLTSLYIPRKDTDQIKKNYVPKQVFYETTIPIATLWVRK